MHLYRIRALGARVYTPYGISELDEIFDFGLFLYTL